MQQGKKWANPILLSMQFVEYLERNPGSTYDDLGDKFQISKARVCQIIALVKKLPGEIMNYLLTADDTDMAYFTERKLRELTTLETDIEKINRFNEIKREKM